MNILVTGGTGTVGGQVVSGLLSAGYRPRVMVRDQRKAASLPHGAEAVAGDLQQASTLPNAMRGMDAVFLLTALAQDETAQGLAAVEAAKAAGVGRIVYMSVHQLDLAPHIPHFATKIPIEKAIRESGMEYTFLQPNNFYQNDYWFKDAILQYGVYPQPLGSRGTNRVDARDIGDAAVNALTKAGHQGKAYPLIGPDALSGEQCAEAYSRHLGREIRYGGDDLDAWAAQAVRMLPEWLVHDLCIMYGHFQKSGLLATGEEFALQAEVLGHAPRRFEDFVRETTAQWKG